jgi:hypothetical protein
MIFSAEGNNDNEVLDSSLSILRYLRLLLFPYMHRGEISESSARCILCAAYLSIVSTKRLEKGRIEIKCVELSNMH